MTTTSTSSVTNSASTALINSLGAGTGVDLKALAQGLADAEITPRKEQVNTKISTTEAKISGYGAVLASLNVIKTAFQGLENPSSVLKPVVDASTTSAFSVTAGSTAAPGSYSLRVVQLASGQRTVSNAFSSGDVDLNGGAAFSLQLSVNGGTAKTIRVPTAAASPAGVVSAINGAKLGLTATLVNKADGSANPYSIVITGEDGASKSFTLNSDDGSGSGEVQKLTFGAATTSGNIRVAGVTVAVTAGDSASAVAAKVKTALEADSYITGFSGRSVVNNQDGSLSLNFAASDGDMNDVALVDADATGVTLSTATPTSFVAGAEVSGLSFTQDGSSTAQDAIVEFNGTTVHRTSNQITDLVKGLTFSLKQTMTASAPVTVTQDTSGLKEKIQALVKSYNDMVSDMSILTGEKNTQDTTDVYSGSLRSDSTARAIRNTLRSMFTGFSSTPGGTIKSLSDIGVSITREGTLELDETKFNTALAANPTQIATMLTADKENKSYVSTLGNLGFAGDAIKKLNAMISSSGTLNTLTKNANTQVTKYQSELTKLDERMSLLLTRYNKQFTTMQSFVSETSSMKTSLKTQFDNLAAMYKSS